MDPYLKRYNNFVGLSEILTSSGKHLTDLPTLPQYCYPTGQSLLCWYSVLGKCFRGPWCKVFRGHVTKGEAMDTFADAVSDCISKGVIYYTNLPAKDGSPRNKQKGRMGPPAGP